MFLTARNQRDAEMFKNHIKWNQLTFLSYQDLAYI